MATTVNIDHPLLAELGEKARRARDLKNEYDQIDKESTAEIKIIMDELEESSILVDNYLISLSQFMKENVKGFKEELLNRGVDSATIEEASAASKTVSRALRIVEIPVIPDSAEVVGHVV